MLIEHMTYINVFFVTEADHASHLRKLASRCLDGFVTTIGMDMPENPGDYTLIVLWNLRRIITNIPESKNTIVLHSSDLPKGRGWAPIYHSIADLNGEHVISAILAAPLVDAGDVVAKARFTIDPSITAVSLRRFDEEACMIMIYAILNKYPNGSIQAVPQYGQPTYYSRRSQADNEIDIEKPFAALIPHLRACEPPCYAHFFWHGVKYNIFIQPETPPELPPELFIEFPSDATVAKYPTSIFLHSY
mgnify:CR=1 FL=1